MSGLSGGLARVRWAGPSPDGPAQLGRPAGPPCTHSPEGAQGQT